jgi:hypothetical protein
VGSSKKQTIGYKYFLGMHLVWLHAADRLLEIMFDRKSAWTGNVTGGTINVSAEKLYGGEKKEGGVSGAIDVEFGSDAQTENAYLQSQLGADIPAFRRVVGFVMKKFYFGMNPYLKMIAARFQRIHTTTDYATQWYDAKAGVGSVVSRTPVIMPEPWVNRGSDLFIVGAGHETGGSYASFQGWLEGNIDSFRITKNVARYTTEFYPVPTAAFPSLADDPYGNQVVLLLRMEGANGSTVFTDDCGHTVNTVGGAVITTARSKFGSSSGAFNGTDALLECDMGDDQDLGDAFTIEGWIWQDAQEVVIPNEYYGSSFFGYGPLNVIGHYNLVGTDGAALYFHHFELDPLAPIAKQNLPPPVPLGQWNFFSVSRTEEGNTYLHLNGELVTGTTQDVDMNPAHIVRECLLDPDWGMGYLAADVDDASFTAAADQLHLEGMGMSILWDRQMPLEDFIKEVVRHFNGALYVSRDTGKFVLDLIRNDYDYGDLLVLNGDNVDRVENFSYATFGEQVNSVTVVGYGPNNDKISITENDPALVQMEGNVINTTIQYPGFSNEAILGKVCLRDLASLSRPLRSCTIYADVTARELNIGKPFILDWPEWNDPATVDLGPIVMRVQGMALGDGVSNKVRLTVMQDVFAVPDEGAVTPPDEGGWEDPSGAPMPALTRLVVEAPYYELLQQTDQAAVDELFLAYPDAGFVLATAERPAPGAINAEIWTDAGAGYESVGNTDFCPTAVLDEDIDTFDGKTWAITGGVDLDEVVIGTRCVIDAEECVVEALSDTSITIGRGALDSVPRKHLTGAKIFFADDFAQPASTQFAEAENVNVKLLTMTGGGRLLLSAAPYDVVTMASRAVRPYPPGKLRIDGAVEPVSAAGLTTLTWTHRDRVLQADQLVDTEAANVGPGEYTRYALRIFDDMDVLLVEKLNIAGATADFDLAYTGDVTIEFYAIDDAGESWQKHERTFAYTVGTAVVDEIISDDYVPPSEEIIIDGGGD